MGRMLKIDDDSPLFDKSGMFYKEFPSDFRQIRYFTLLIVQKAPQEIREINLLEQQISEVIKNAIKHGNKSNPDKKVRVWYYFDTESVRLIVEDEGEGFKELERWNTFNEKRLEYLKKEDYEKLADYVAFTTENSDYYDGGNALFAAVEYWNDGVVWTTKKTCVAVKKTFPKTRIGIEFSE